MIKISVIIPTYNSAKYIAEALNSVMGQTYPVHEIIVVDDGSTDNTGAIVKEIASVRYFHQDNRGPAAARNTGIKEATGEHIAFLDADDLWLPGKLEKQMALFDNSDYAMVYCDMSHMVKGKLVHESYLKEGGYKHVSSGNIYPNLLKENFIFTPTVIVKKKIFDDVGHFDENYRTCEDYKMWLNIARKYQVGFLNELLVVRRRHESNITGNKYLFVTSGIKLFEELLKIPENSWINRMAIRNGLGERLFNLGYCYWKNDQYGLARHNFIRATKYGRYDVRTLLYIACTYLSKNMAAYRTRGHGSS